MTKERELLRRALVYLSGLPARSYIQDEIEAYLSTPSDYETHLKVNDMRKLNIGTGKYTRVFALDEKHFNANHVYGVTTADNDEKSLVTVRFQVGPIKENGVNGCMNEDLIAMVIDRLESFQDSPYKCRENALAITKLEEALLWLRKRTMDREARGVEGTHVV